MHCICNQLWLDLTGRYARIISNELDVKKMDCQLLIPIGSYKDNDFWSELWFEWNHGNNTKIRAGGISWYIWAPNPEKEDIKGIKAPVILAGRYGNHFYIVYAEVHGLKNLLRTIELHGLEFYQVLQETCKEAKSFMGTVYSLECFTEGVCWDRLCKEMSPWNIIAFGTPWLEKYCWNIAERQLMWIQGKELDELEWLGYCAVAGWSSESDEEDNSAVLPGIYQLVDIGDYQYVGQCVMSIEAYTPEAFLRMYCKTHKNYLGRKNKQDYLFLKSSEDGLNFRMLHVMLLNDAKLTEWIRRAGYNPTQEMVSTFREKHLNGSHIFASTMYTSKVNYFCDKNAVIKALINQNRKGAGIAMEDIHAASAALFGNN